MLKLQKKQVKFVSLAIAVMFLLGIVGLAVSQSSTSYAAESNNSSKIGVVNHQLLISQHPDMEKAQQTMQAEVEQAKKDFEEKSATMNDKEKQDYYAQVQQRLTLKEQELINPVFEKVDAAIKAVADAKGLSVVMDKGNVVYGGQDITAEVGKKISGK
ncbi:MULTISPECIES: OmpH family outer membrane protein [Pelosinus]|uniref:Outer membrane chaperone Skp (OmpH) n=1 Tax=Pelosinus fermentans B4 TaxID=1149862 RepID=I9L6H7_9FIRM|nr:MULTISPECIES: OmpH family outer membrane protein [Pelosinus]EIW15974.1 outer membrane chaperone Skp (OmpH) [Pelosinus fermentans B4]EIW27320.1 outer membrane chaperone Skp (OmpH) [Pelosinus fermentans A11]OAM92724.1 outer membrane chaperone Skp (OmpH) [Pelosinus fermentans DSM 17108]SDQ54917.1 periplasmic chaperone for outer membrane proteins Skp [Pelosinus fermentans]